MTSTAVPSPSHTGTHLAQAPQHREQDTLDTVGDELGAQTTAKQATHALLLNNGLQEYKQTLVSKYIDLTWLK